MRVEGYSHFGGRHGESAAIKNLLAHAGVTLPGSKEPLSEALCFGIAGGIGAGYSFCPSVPKSGMGSGVSVVGRHKSYATDASWYQGFFDRIGARTRVTETTSESKALANLKEELASGRPAVVWCSRPRLPFLGNPIESCDLWMHSFVIHEIDEGRGLAHGADRAPTQVSLSLDELAAARAGICSHRNRSLSFEKPGRFTAADLRLAIQAGLAACAQELLQPRIKTFSLPGLEIWAKMITNDKNKDGWKKVFAKDFMYCALRDVFVSIETAGTGGGLYRGMYADFLEAAAKIAKEPKLRALAAEYRGLGDSWTHLAESALPSSVKPLKQTKDLLRKKCLLFETKGESAQRELARIELQLADIEKKQRQDFSLSKSDIAALLEGLRQEIIELHEAESQAAQRLADCAA